MSFTVEIDREEDGRWIADVLELPGVMAYGMSHEEALKKVKTLALRVLADQIDSGAIDAADFHFRELLAV